jgi:hypothetical protein
MRGSRGNHTATLLPNGNVLVTGGTGAATALASAELYVSSGGTFSPAPNMATARTGHTATLLSSGQVLVVGGVPGAGPATASAELYRP